MLPDGGLRSRCIQLTQQPCAEQRKIRHSERQAVVILFFGEKIEVARSFEEQTKRLVCGAVSCIEVLQCRIYSQVVEQILSGAALKLDSLESSR